MPVNHITLHLARWRERLSHLLLPPRCLICGEAAAGPDLCAGCIAGLPDNTACCQQCALPLATAAPACGECLASPPPFTQAATAWRYEAAIAQLLPRLKFHDDLASGQALARLAAQRLASWPGWQGVDRILPMPLHVRRLARRGYNQALELARPLARTMGVPLDVQCLSRIRATAPQTDLDAPARRRNLRGAFAASMLAGETVVIVDDVITTGATMREAARTLRRAGAGDVRVLAIARVP